MEKRSVQAQFQLLDSYIKEFEIHTIQKINEKKDININGQLGFRINGINENKGNFIGEIELINDIKIVCNNDEYANIHVSMIGVFSASKDGIDDKEKFEGMLKINGATTLSHLIRAYVYSVTGLSGIPQITTPMINFIDFFKNLEEEKNNTDNNN